MLFNSFEFLIFCPIVIVVFYCISHTYRWLWLLLASYYFYMASEPSLVILLLISTFVDYYSGLKINVSTSQKVKKTYLGISLLTNLTLLFSFKYLNFFTENVEYIARYLGFAFAEENSTGGYNFSKVVLPVGISFYTFQTMSYSIDVYRGHIEPERHLGKFALFVAFFPQLVAGPIERANRLIPQLNKHVYVNSKDIRQGVFYMAWGLFLKIVVADRLGIYVDEAFNDPEGNQGLPLLLGHWFFGFQIYYDFAAYTSIAIGAAKTLGIDLMQNFNRSFFFKSAEEFWKKWHISLTQWFRDYLYRPLTRVLKIKRFYAVLIVFFVTGLWHGANWTFIIWGLLNAFLLILEVASKSWRLSIFQKFRVSKKMRTLPGYLFVLSYVMFSLIFFRSPSVGHALFYIQQLFEVHSLHINILNNYFELGLSIFLIIAVQLIHYYKGNAKIHELVLERSTIVRWSIYVCFIFSIVLLGLNRQNTFIYFQF